MMSDKVSYQSSKNEFSNNDVDFGEIQVFHDAWVGCFIRKSGRGPQLRGGFQFPVGTPSRFLDFNWQFESPLPDFHVAPLQSGNFLYGGLFDPHFGHFMVECIHRLWAWRHTGGTYDGLVFAPTPRHRPKALLPGFVMQTLAWFGIPLERVIFLNEPRRFACLHVPEVGKHRGRGPSPGYLAMLAKVLDLPEPHGHGDRLYLSRRRLPWNNGRFLAEAGLEYWLSSHGFEILYPETMTLAEQVARYQGAVEILIAQGSAVHGLELIPHLKSRVVVIQRSHTQEGRVSLQDRVNDYSFIDAIDWIDGFYSRNLKASALNPNQLLQALEKSIDACPNSLDHLAFFEQEFSDFMQWFQSDIDRSLQSFVYTETEAQSILSGYALHLARHGTLSIERQIQLQRMADIYGNGSALLFPRSTNH